MTRRRTRSHEQRLAANRRFGVIPGRRFALGVGVGVGLVGCFSNVALADPMVTATVHRAGGLATTESVSIAALQAEPAACQPYSGPAEAQLGINGLQQAVQPGSSVWALATVLACLKPTPITPAEIQAVTVTDTQGNPEWAQSSVLLPVDLADPSDFFDNREVPLVTTDGTHAIYYRPQRSPSDDNFEDSVTPASSTLEFDVYEGPLLTVTTTPSAANITAGTSVTFSAAVTGGTGALSYSWNGGAPSTATSFALSFPTAGFYPVTVDVTDDAGGGGGATIPVTVSGSSASPPPPPPAATTPTGPLQSSGTVVGGSPGALADAPAVTTPTAARGATGAAGSAKPKPSHRTSTMTNSTTASAITSTTSSATATESSVAGGVGSAGSSPGPSSVGSPPSAVGSPETHGPAHTTGPSTRATTGAVQAPAVSGLLISDVTPLPPGASPLAQGGSRAGTAPAVKRPTITSPLAVIAGILAVVLLFALGVGRELGWRRPGHARPLSS